MTSLAGNAIFAMSGITWELVTLESNTCLPFFLLYSSPAVRRGGVGKGARCRSGILLRRIAWCLVRLGVRICDGRAPAGQGRENCKYTPQLDAGLTVSLQCRGEGPRFVVRSAGRGRRLSLSHFRMITLPGACTHFFCQY